MSDASRHAGPVAGFLTDADTPALRRGLRGVTTVEIRQIGAHPSAAAEVSAFLETEGVTVSVRQIDRMVPPPLRRLVFRYVGDRAELTIAPDALD